MDRTKVNEKASGITASMENDIVTIIKNAVQQHKNFLGDVCNYVATVLCQRYDGWWCCMAIDKDANYGSRIFHFDHMFLDITVDSKRFIIFKSSK